MSDDRAHVAEEGLLRLEDDGIFDAAQRYTSSCYTALAAISDALERYRDISNLKRCGVLGNPQYEILLWQP